MFYHFNDWKTVQFTKGSGIIIGFLVLLHDELVRYCFLLLIMLYSIMISLRRVHNNYSGTCHTENYGIIEILVFPNSPMCLVLDIKHEHLLCITSLSIVHKNLGQGSLCPQRRPSVKTELQVKAYCGYNVKVNID